MGRFLTGAAPMLSGAAANRSRFLTGAAPNLGYDLTSIDLRSGELRLIEVNGLGEATGTILLTPKKARRGRRPPRLLLAVRRHALQHHAAAPGTD